MEAPNVSGIEASKYGLALKVIEKCEVVIMER